MSGCKSRFLHFLFALGIICLPSRQVRAGDVNSAAALRSLERAVSSLAGGNWQNALFEARLGSSYDETLADFSYIEALASLGSGGTRFSSISFLEDALATGRVWRTYTAVDAEILCASLYVDTLRYDDALARLKDVPPGFSAESDLVRIRALYGKGRNGSARTAIRDALDRWPFDSRFARAFFIHESTQTPSAESLTIASLLVSRLYIWQDSDRELLLLSVPFLPNPESRVRHIRIYRSMGKNDAERSFSRGFPSGLSSIRALEYGIMGEREALSELFSSAETGIEVEHVMRFFELTGDSRIRSEARERLSAFNGILHETDPFTGAVRLSTRYNGGKPLSGYIDRDTDGRAEYTFDCDLGVPRRMTAAGKQMTVNYDAYPAVRSVTIGNSEYILQPLALAWAPLSWKPLFPESPDSLFFIFSDAVPSFELTERSIRSQSVYFIHTDSDNPSLMQRYHLDGGSIVSSEERENGKLFSRTQWKSGVPYRADMDRDRDGYFETVVHYSADGNVREMLVDINGDRQHDYQERFSPLGDTTLRWDSDHDGAFDISLLREPSGREIVTWHSTTLKRDIRLETYNGEPRSLTADARSVPIVRDPFSALWWIERLPARSVELSKQIIEIFNREPASVVLRTVTIDGQSVQAVRTGGVIVASIVE